VKLFFSHLQGDSFAVHSQEEYQRAVLLNPKAQMVFIDNDRVKFFNSDMGEYEIGDTSGDVVVLDASDKKSLIGCYGKKVIGINVTSPPILSNYPFWGVAVELNEKLFVTPNGKVSEDRRKIKGWKKYGDTPLEFNRTSFMEASKLAKYTQKGLIKTVKKPLNKPDNPFFDPKFVKSKENTSKSTLVKRQNSLLSKKEVEGGLFLCDKCKFMEHCPKFQSGSVCAYSKRFKELAPLVKTRDIDLLGEVLQKIMEKESERYMRGVTMEEMSGDIDRDVTNLGEALFNKVKDFISIMKPVLNQAKIYNILNQQVNIAVGVEKLEDAGLTQDQRTDMAEEIEGIIQEQKRKTAS